MKTYDQAKQKYLDHATDKAVMRKLSPSHIIGIKKLEIEERKLQLETDFLKAKVLKSFLGSAKVIEGEVDGSGLTTEITGGSEESKV